MSARRSPAPLRLAAGLALMAFLLPFTAPDAIAAVNLSATKTDTDDNGGSPRPSEVITYTITISNSGTTAATNVNFSDAIPANTTFLPGTLTSDDPTDILVEGNPVQVQVGGLAAAGGGDNNVVITFKVQIVAGAANGLVISNQGTVTADGPITLPTDDPATGAAGDATLFTVVNPLDVTLTKTRNVATQAPGGNIVYTLTYGNAGSVAATNITLFDFVPTNTTFVSATGGGVLSGGLVTWSIASIPAGGSGSRQFTVQVNAGVLAGTVIGNSGSISFQDDLGNTQDPKTSNTVTTTVSQGAGVVVDPDQTGTIRPANGSNYTYTFTVTNTGNGTDRFDLTDVKVQTPFPLQIELLNAAGTVIARDDATADGTWDFVLAASDTDSDGLPDTGNMAAGATLTYQVRVTKTLGGGNGATDITSIVATSNFNPAVSESATFATTVSNNVNSMALTKTDTPDPVAAGANITYTIALTNNGSSGVTGVVVSDVVPANATFVSASAPGTLGGGTVTWNFAALAAGATQNLTLTVQVGAAVPNGTVISNTASADSIETTPIQSVATTTVQSPVSFATSTKSVNFVSATPGATLTYTISVVNSGVSGATGVVVTDTIPPNTTYVAGSITGIGANAAGNPNLVWNVGNVASGATVNLTYQVRIDNPIPAGTTSITNAASIDSNETTPLATNTATTNVTAAPNFSLSTKSVTDLNGGLVTTGDTLRFTIVVRNSGNMNATGVVVNDTPPAGTTYLAGSITGTGADASGAPNLLWNVGALNGAGATSTLTFDAVIGDAVAGGTVISNTAPVDSDQTAPVNTTTATATVQGGFSGTLVSTATINPGQVVTITLTDRNLNTNPATVQTTTLTTVNQATGESETRTYTETGADTGIFTSTVATVFGTTAGTNNDGTFNVQAGDTLRTTYNDAFTATGGIATVTADTTVITSCVSGAINAMVTILPGQGIAVNLNDNDLNTNPATVQTVNVTVTNGTTGEIETLTLTETGVNTGVFTGTLATVQGVVADPTIGLMAVAKDDVVTSSVTDACSGTGGPVGLSDMTTVIQPVLAVSKTDAPDPVAAGASIVYTLSYSNTGTAAATGTLITDTVPANTTFVSATGGGTEAAGVVTWNLGLVGAGASGSVQVTVQVASPLANGTIIDNTTYGIDSNETAAVAGAAVQTTVTSAPVLGISKAESADPVPAGSNLTYTISYGNTGTDTATAVVVTDTVPANTTFLSATAGGTEAAGVVTWNLANLAAGGTGSVQMTVQVNSPLPNGTVLSNGTYAIDCAETVPAGGAAVTTTVTSDPILNISKTDAPDPAVAGTDTITYTILYSNSGTAAATGVVITDTVPAGTTFVSATGGGTLAAGVVTWNIGNLAAGASTSVQMTVSINVPVANGAIITNATYAIDSNETSPVAGAAITTTVLSDPRFNLGKTDAPDPVAAGSNITYTLSYQNIGTNNATGTVISDTLPANTSFVSATGGGTLAAGVVTWNIGAVNAGASGSVQLVVQAASPLPNGTVITNTGWTIDSNESLPQTGPNATTTVTSAPVLNVSKTDAPDPVSPGSNITYTIAYSNTGNMNASGVVLTDVIPANTSFVSATGGGTAAGGVVTWNIGALNAGVSASVQMVVQVASPLPNGTLITNNTFQIDSNETAPVAGAAITTTVTSNPILNISKTDAPDPVIAGGTITYTISYSNTGSANASGVMITDTVPANTAFVSATAGGALAAGVVTWNIGALNAGASGSVQLVVQTATPLANGTTITNATYAIDSNETAPTAGAAVTTTVSSAPILAVSKSDSPDPVAAGSNLTYTLSYSNTGNANASSVVITDTVPANTSFVSATSGGTFAAGVVTWTIGALNAGAAGSVQLVVQVASPLANGTVLTNATYAIDSAETAPVGGAATTTTVTAAPVLTITKTDAPDPIPAGNSLTYTINYGNTGNENASGVVITDTVPANTSFVSATGGGTFAAGVVTWNIGALNAGASGSVQMVVQVTTPLADGTLITNATYAIDSTQTVPVAGAAVQTTVSATPVLNISKTDAPDPVSAGSNITYTISYSNTGSDAATGVVITDTVPANTSFVSATGGGALAAGVVTWNIGNLAAGGSGSVQLVVQAASPLANGTVITNGTYAIDSTQTSPTAGAAVTTTVTSAPVLNIAKTDAPDPVSAGGNLTYTINYSNTGNANATGVVIADTVPANTSFVSATGGGTLAAGVVTWTIGALNAGAAGSVQLVVQVASPLANGTTITNATYNIDSTETAPVAGAAVTTTVSAAPVLTVSKSEAPDPVNAGANLTYTLSYSNIGSDAATGVVITDTVPANTSFVSATGGGAFAAGVVTWNIGNLAAGGSGSVQMVVQVASPLANGTILTNASYAIDCNETAPVAGAAVTTTVSSAPVLNISKTDAPDPVSAGSNITYTVSYSNTGNMNASGVVITDTVPANTSFVSATGGGTPAAGVVTWNIGALNAGASGSVQLVVQVVSPLANGTTITNATYAIDSTETAPVSGAAISTTVTSAPVLNVSKTDAPDPVNAGSNITYTLSYSNTGNANATGVVLTDTVPANTSFVSVTGGGTLAAGVVTWNIGILGAGASGSVQLVVQVASPLANGTTITNAAYGIDSNETAPTAGAAVTTTVSSAPILSLSKTDSADPVAAGSSLTYTLSYSNTGNMNTTGAVITDTVPANTTFVSATGGGSFAAGVVTWNIGALNAGASGSVQMTVQVNSPLPNGTVLSNATYSIDTNQTAPLAGAVVTTTVTSDPILNVSKTDGPDPAVAGTDNITYTLSYTNTGNADATGAVITDTLPAGTTFVSATGGGSLAAGVVTWNLGVVAAGASGSVQMVVSINTPVANGAIITNATYAIDCNETVPVGGAAVTTTVNSDVTFNLTKTDAPDPVAAGATITYTLAWQNTGTSNATGVVLSDPLPANTTFVSATGGGTPAAGVVTWNIGNVAAGASGSVQLVVQVATPLANGTIITNTGWTIDSNESLPDAGPDALTTVTSAPVLNVSKTDAPDPVSPGGSITYAIAYSNTGNMNAGGVVLTDAIPANTTFVSATGGGTNAAGVVTWNLGGLNAGASGSVQLVVQVNTPLANGTVIANDTYQIDSAETTPTAGAVVNTTVTSSPALNISKTDSPDPVNAGSDITYTIAYSNTGTADATGVVITDTLPANTTFGSATGGGTEAAGVVTWNLGNLPAGASGSVQLGAQVVTPLANGTIITNGAYAIDSNETAPTAGAAVTTTVNSVPVLSISKTGAPEPVAAGGTITYTLTANNTGTADATGATMTDALPANTSFVSATGGGTASLGIVTWNVGTLAASGTVTRQLVVSVDSPLPNGSLISNTTYAIDSSETAAVAGVPVSNTVTATPALTATKAFADVNGGSFQPGDTVTYTITVTNGGNGTATGVVLSDPIPANTTLVTGSLTSDDPTDVLTEADPVQVAIGDLGPDPDVVITFQVLVGAGTANGTVISNQGAVTANGGISIVTDDPSTVAANDATSRTVTALPNPWLEETVADLNGGSLNPGDILEYTLTVTNPGSAAAAAVVVSDAVPAGTTYVAGSITGTGADDSGVPALTWSVGAVNPGQTVLLTYRVTVDAGVSSGAVIGNQGNLTAAGGITRVSDDPGAADAVESGNDPADPADDDPTLTAPVFLGDVLQVGISADLLAARRGEFVLYMVTIRNPTSGDVNSIDLSDLLPPGLKMMPGTLTLDGIAQADPAPAIPLIVPIGTVAAGATRTVTYRAVVTPGAPLGAVETVALGQDAAAQPLSPLAIHALMVVEDAEFDLATIVGKVFDDKDGNGVQGMGEKGIGGVMVAMEDGIYALTDGNGMYHIAAVKPGNRLIKIGRHTLPPHERLTLPEAQTATITPGLLVKINFGVKLRPPTTVRQGQPGTYGVAVASEKAESPAEIIGNLEDMTAVVNGVRASLPKARVKMDVMSLERNLRIVNGRLERPAVFKISYPQTRAVKEWTFEIFDAAMRRVRGFRGSDLKTTEVVWDGKDASGRLMKGGAIYQYQLSIEFSDGSLSKSPLRMFGINRTQAIAFELTGASFEVNSDRLKADAAPILDKIVVTLKGHADEKVVVRGHTDNTGDPVWNAKLSLQRAEAVRNYLVLSGIAGDRLLVEGRGAAEPVAANNTGAGRARNRRVEIKALLEETEHARTLDAGPAAGQTQVVVNGRNVPVDEDGSFHTTVDSLKDGGRVYVGIRTEDGGVAATTVKLPSISILEPTTNVKLEIGKREDVIRLMQPAREGEKFVYPTVKIPVRGRTEAGNQVYIDGEEVQVDAKGVFRTNLPLAVGENTFGVVAVAPDGTTSLVNLAVNLAGIDKNREIVTVRKPVPQFSIELPARGAVLQSPNLFVRGTAPAKAMVTVNNWRIPVLPNGNFAGTVRLPEGPSVLNVVVNMPNSTEGRVGVPIEVRSGYFFLVALGDATVHSIKTEGRAPQQYEDDLYVDGRAAFYLKGRIQGRYLITAGLDTGDGRLSDIGSRLGDRDNSEFTRNLDPDAFYPVYGDASRTVNDTNSQGRFYVLFEAPSYDFQWGNYNSGITGNEFASFNRSLYGAKGTWHTVSRGKDGKPMGQAIIFAALPETRAAHDEFTGTGGSLYLLRNQDVVPGSEKVRIEVRDKITGIPVANVTRRNYVDYEIDYAAGRILFREPVQSVVASGTLISEQVLNGDPVAVVVDYEYRSASMPATDDTTYGARVKGTLGERVTVGVTHVEEERTGSTYTLSGGDVSMRLGESTTVSAEFSQSENEALPQWESTDGGLSFTQKTVPATTEPAQAFRFELASAKGRAKGTAYFRHIDAGFSSSFTAGTGESDQFGGTASIPLGKSGSLDILLDNRDFTGLATDLTGTLQLRQSFGRLGLTAEARYRDTDLVAGTDTTEGIGAVRFDFKATPKLNLFVRYQDDFMQDTDDTLYVFESRRQAGVGVEAQVSPKITARAELISAENGDGALVGVTTRLDPRTVLYGTYTMSPDQAGVMTGALTLGASTGLGDRTRLYTEEQFKSNEREASTSNVVGLSTRFSDRLTTSVALERSRLDGTAGVDVLRQAASASASYANPWLRIFSKYEIRQDEDTVLDRDQWLTTNAVELKLSRDLTLLGRYSYGETTDGTLDESIFREQSVGFAYRPVARDWAQILIRYTEVRNLPTAAQAVLPRDDREDRVFSFQTVIDLHRRLSLTEKFAIRDRSLTPELALSELKSRMKLWINRFNWRLGDLWDAAVEYRTLSLEEAGDSTADGFLLEVNRLLWNHLRLGVGYNFTEFTDNEFTANDYSAKGFFFRVQGKY